MTESEGSDQIDQGDRYPIEAQEVAAQIYSFSDQPERAQRVWGYVRVSSEKQSSNNESLSMQESAIQRYCEVNGLSKPTIVREVASATKEIFTPEVTGSAPTGEALARPTFMTLVGCLMNVPNAHLIVWKLDRFAREVVDQELLLRLLWSNGVEVHSTLAHEEDILKGAGDDPQRNMFRVIMGAFGQYEAKAIENRMRAGQYYKASKGGFLGGVVPFGYKSVDAELVPDEYKAKVVRFVFLLKQKFYLSERKIATMLMEGKHPSDTTKYYKSKISRILRNEMLYKGTYTDRFGNDHYRPDLVILPTKLSELEEAVRLDQEGPSHEQRPSA